MFTQAISGIRSTCKLTLGLFSFFGVLDLGRRFCGSQLDFVAELICGPIREVGRCQAVRAFRLKQQLSKAQSIGSERRGHRSFIAGDSSYGLPLGYLLQLLACSCFIIHSLVTGSLMLGTMTCRQQLPCCLARQCMCKCIPLLPFVTRKAFGRSFCFGFPVVEAWQLLGRSFSRHLHLACQTPPRQSSNTSTKRWYQLILSILSIPFQGTASLEGSYSVSSS